MVEISAPERPSAMRMWGFEAKREEEEVMV